MHRRRYPALHRRVLVLLTEKGVDALDGATRHYSHLVREAAEAIRTTPDEQQLLVDNCVELPEHEFSGAIRRLRAWHQSDQSSPLPATLAARSLVLTPDGNNLTNFKIDQWGRGLIIAGGRSFVGERMGVLKSYTTAEYWKIAGAHYVRVIKEPAYHTYTGFYSGVFWQVQRALLPLHTGQLLMTSWLSGPIDIPEERAIQSVN